MADNNNQANSTSPAQSWDKQQAAIQRQQRAVEAADTQAIEAANRAARSRPGGELDIMNPSGNVQYVAAPAPDANAAKPKRGGKKGK